MDLVELLENELDAVPRLGRFEKMRLRTSIRRQGNWLLMLENPKPAKIIFRLEGRLAEIFRLYPPRFKEKLGRYLKEKCLKLDRASPE
jgi:hypothetical protein